MQQILVPSLTQKSLPGLHVATDLPEVGYLRLLPVILKLVSYFYQTQNRYRLITPGKRWRKYIYARAFKSSAFVTSPRIQRLRLRTTVQ